MSGEDAAFHEEDSLLGPSTSAILQRPLMLRSVAARISREARYRRLLAVADGLSALAVTLSAAKLADANIKIVLVVVPFVAVLIAKVQGLYDRDDMVIQKSTLSEWRGLLLAALLTGIGTYTAWHLLTSSRPAHGVRLLAFLVFGMFALTLLARVLARELALRLSPPERCAIVGSPDVCRPLAACLDEIRGVEMLEVIPTSQFGSTIAEVGNAVDRLDVQRVIVGPHAPWRELQTLELIRSLKWLGVRVSLMPSIMGVIGEATVVEHLDGSVVLGVPTFGLSRSSLLLKRCFDLLLGTIACAVVLIPALVIAALIKLDSPGAVLFRQTRVGRDGQRFKMYKFRSMVPEAERMKVDLHAHNEATNGLFKIKNDPRVTRVGRLLRRSYLDELPQLINVMLGEMSLVGPRPLIETEDALLTGADRHRLVLIPGMTGPWQLRGPLYASLPDLAKLDYLYASNWSVWRDLDIIIATVARVFRRHGH